MLFSQPYAIELRAEHGKSDISDVFICFNDVVASSQIMQYSGSKGRPAIL